MLRRPLLLLLSTVLALAPAGAAVGEEADPGTTEETVSEATALTALADLVDAIAAALGIADVEGAGETVALDDEQRDVLRGLLDQVLEAIKVETLIASADASLLTEDQDPVTEVEGETADADADGGTHGQIVSTVARCAPRGHGMRGLFESVKNHGAFVRTAAQGGSVTLTVPVLTGTGTDVTVGPGSLEVTHDLTSVAAAEALCADLEVITTAAALARADDLDGGTDVDGRPDRAELDAAKAERRADRDAARAERAEARDAEKAERREARDAAKAQRRSAKADRAGTRTSD